MSSSTKLFVDLDGTLIKSDLLYESLAALIKLKFHFIFLLPLWLFKGKAAFKSKISEYVSINPETLPYNSKLLDYLLDEHKNGREIYLATASNIKFANLIAGHLGIFSGVIASTDVENLAGNRKLKAIREITRDQKFCYAGNSHVDLEIFDKAETIILANPETGLRSKADKLAHIDHVYIDRTNFLKSLFKAIRIQQWIKNILIFVPLFIDQQWIDSESFLLCITAFFLFSLTASSIYLFNDMMDLEADRVHPRKKYRPFASGSLSLGIGAILVFFLPIVSLSTAYLISAPFFYILILYLLVTICYSLLLKSYVLVDVVVLGGLYTIRVVAGAAIIGIWPSFWLLAFSMFIFISLALVKRCSELIMLKGLANEYAEGRDYSVDDLPILQSMGIASGYASILVVALFINSPAITVQYTRPEILWMVCPILIYWVSRIWLKTQRGEMDDDPIVFSVRDKASQLMGLCMVATVLLAV